MSVAPGAVVLHIGLPKTGTTYLQSLLWAHRDALREAGVLLPGFGPREHLWASCDLREEPRLARRHADAPGSWTRLSEQLTSWPGTGLITHEFLCGASADQVGRAVAAWGEREVHVVVTAREIVALVTARWQEWVKNGATGAIDDYPASVRYRPADEWGWGTLDLARVLERWSVHVPRERVHLICPPEEGAPREELWRRFAGVLGLDPGLVDARRARGNETLGVVEVELLRRINADLRDAGEFTKALDRGVWIRGYLAEERLAALGGADAERFWPSPGRVAQLREHGDAGLEQIAAGGYDVVGSLETLRTPEPLPPRRHPSEVGEGELVAGASRLVAAMLTDVRGARRDADGARSLSQGEPVSRERRGRRLWQAGHRRGPKRTDG